MKPLIGVSCDADLGHARDAISPGEGVYFLKSDYVQAVWDCGGTPVLIPCHGGTEAIAQHLSYIHGLLLTGGAFDIEPHHYGEEPHRKLGPINPPRTVFELDLSRAAAEQRLPILGICGGVQLLNVCFGGSLFQDLPSQQPQSVKHQQGASSQYPIHTVTVDPDSRLGRAIGCGNLRVNSTHHQAIKDVGTWFRAVAQAEDGVVEAIECCDENLFIMGVQWHPERLYTREQACRRIFEEFIKAAEKYRLRHNTR